MFCSNCGKNLPDDSRFCDGCGAQLGVAPATTTPARAPSPIIQNFLKVLKGIFSKNIVKTVGEASQSQGSEWILLALVPWITYTFALCTKGSRQTNRPEQETANSSTTDSTSSALAAGFIDHLVCLHGGLIDCEGIKHADRNKRLAAR